MSQHAGLHKQTQHLLEGPLKHVKAAALAAALLPLASVAAAPAAAQTTCATSSGTGLCGFVWDDTTPNGIQEPGEPGIEGAVVSLPDGSVTATDPSGFYAFEVPPGTYEVTVQIPPGTQASPPNQGVDDTTDSDGEPNPFGGSVATVVYAGGTDTTTDFGFFTPTVAVVGTGTPGYWKNHPEAWPVTSLSVGGITYTQQQILGWFGSVSKDKTVTMASSLVAAKLNVLAGTDSSCVSQTITDADGWMATYGPVGSKVHAASLAWKIGEPYHRHMDNYNNGMLCAPHRD